MRKTEKISDSLLRAILQRRFSNAGNKQILRQIGSDSRLPPRLLHRAASLARKVLLYRQTTDLASLSSELLTG